MSYKLYILFTFLTVNTLNAQYFGGSDDGSDQSVLNGSRLNGNIASFSVLYQGSSGDGHNAAKNQVLLSQNTFEIYNGSSGDGFSKMSTVYTISGSDLSRLYFGNSGDGHSQKKYQTILNGSDLTMIYTGSSGDGADKDFAFGQLLNGVIDIIFRGGSGDGFASRLSNDNFLSGVMLLLYQGGSGDGFATNSYTTNLSLDVAEYLIKMDVLLYPNPASQIVTIKPNDGILITSVDVYDISGKKIGIKLSPENSLDVSNLADGVYLVNIFSESGEITKRLIVKK
ncbi:T9SS type A sorting domain-containing protein [Psychroserpens algicola]|uniref:T9SS type A sorting domain-containing protein n=1 Tax=Psychroserpens algicola TaxID=1719034 RepID=A0ABT0HCZ5_9FLAO|nr:T9SS type A sorting domain-containing protein [Psychroserpens algicola]MCK8482237.1 T9SS type A sorting domain-containing protein [Psychroserpens algicola]